jgi:type II secretory ATPase GspE/PulE/Tfp pilus assembly ATPase PilB-like protein
MNEHVYSLEKSLKALTSLSARDLSLCSTQRARELISFTEATKAQLLPLGFVMVGRDPRSILIVAATKDSEEKRKEAQYLAHGQEVRLVVVAQECLMAALFHAYKKESRHVDAALHACNPHDNMPPHTQIAGLSEVTTPENTLLCSLLDHALAWGASDLHMTPTKEGLMISMRVHGDIRTKETQVRNEGLYARLLQRVRVITSMDTTRKDPIQEGSLVIPYLDHTVTARVSIVPSFFGDSLALRFFTCSEVPSIAALGASTTMQEALKRITQRSSGLVLISGATGSGKTTTLYALAAELAKEQRRIISIEDPVERILSNVTQIQIDPRRQVTFASSLKAVLRQDPDVLVIGEIREAAVAEAALQFALTGHLVLTTIHAGSIAEARQRFACLSGQGGAAQASTFQPHHVIFQQLVKNQQEKDKRVLLMHIDELMDDLEALLEIGILSKDDYTRLQRHDNATYRYTSLPTECLHDPL